MAIQERIMIAMQAISETEKSVQELTNAHAFWNTWSVRLVAATVIVTALYFLAQWMTNKRGNELGNTQAALIRAKDEQLARDLKEKDSQIADANRQAGVANERAQKLEGDNIQLRTDLENASADAQSRIEAARAEAGAKIEQARTEAARQVGEVQKDVARQQERAAEAEKALAEVREKIAPRRITAGFPSVRGLDPGGVWMVGIMYKRGDDEAYQFAVNITNTLRSTGWMIDEEPFPIDKDWTMDPIEATTAPKVRPGITILISVGEHLELKRKVLVEGFVASGFTPQVILTGNRPVIIVGSKF